MPLNWTGFALQGSARWIAGGGALAGMAGIVLSQTLLAPDYEVLYSGGVSAAHCVTLAEREACSFTYEFSIGNTGRKAQERVRIEWPLDMERWNIGTQYADIVASARKTPEPRILPAFEAGTTVYTIDALMPNTLVLIRASCLACTRAQLQALREARARVAARGEIAEANPRVSALQHGAMNLLRLAGLFR